MLATFSTRQLSTVPPQPSASSGFAHASGHSFWIVLRHALSSRWFSLQRRRPGVKGDVIFRRERRVVTF